MRFTFGDERCVPPEDDQSNYRMARESLFEPAAVPAGSVLRMRGEIDPLLAAQEYEDQLKLLATQSGETIYRHDLMLLGMGDDGHTASLFPGTLALEEQTRRVVSNYVPKLNTWRLTMTLPLLDQSRHVLFLASGAKNRELLEKVIGGDRTYPAARVDAGERPAHLDHRRSRLTSAKRPHSSRHWLGRAHRLGDGEAFRAGGLCRGRDRQRHAPASFSARRLRRKRRARSWSRTCRVTRIARSTFATLSAVNETFAQYGRGLAAIVHTAAQPSHDWAARDPQMDFTVNANGTLNLLEAARNFCPETPFVFTSTNKVYGDTPNRLPLRELPLRWEIEPGHEYEPGISENMSIDQTKHSLFGASKVAADVLVQEYGRYFGMPTACFRGGCLTGPAHAGTELHGFLSYLMKCTVQRAAVSRFRLQGQTGAGQHPQLRSRVEAFAAFVRQPRVGEVYNMGGSRHSNCSMLEAIELCQEISGRKLSWEYVEDNRIGDHIWWISDVRKFREHYPEWNFRYGLREILEEIHAAVVA